MLDDRERLSRLRLIRTQNIGPVTYHRLVARYGTAARALSALPELSRKSGRNAPLKPASLDDCERELEQAQKHGARLIAS